MADQRIQLNLLKQTLLEKGLTQKWLADELKLSTQTVNHWCTGFRQPSLYDLFVIAAVLSVDVTALINRDAQKHFVKEQKKR